MHRTMNSGAHSSLEPNIATVADVGRGSVVISLLTRTEGPNIYGISVHPRRPYPLDSEVSGFGRLS